MFPEWKKLVVSADDSVQKVIETISRGGIAQIALVADQSGKLLGTITDGDIRRGLLAGTGLGANAADIMHREFHAVSQSDDGKSVVNMLRSNVIRQAPVVDAEGRLCGLYLLEEFLTPARRTNPVVLMAGGLGRRLRPLTERQPKPMLEVGGRPLLETIIDNFIDQGFENFHIAINYLGQKIQQHFADGTPKGVHIEYLQEEQKLGTAGALGLLEARFEEPLIVMNADVLTRIDFARLLEFHEEMEGVATLCLREYDMEVPYGVVETEQHQVAKIVEKPIHTFFVNAGVYVLNPTVLGLINKGEAVDMPEVIQRVISVGHRVAAFPIHEYWLDIGEHKEFERANHDFRRD